MKPKPKLISIEERLRSLAQRTVPVILVQGLPGVEQRSVFSQWLCDRADLKSIYLDPITSLSQDEGCQQCALLEKTLSDLEQAVRDQTLDGVLLAVPFELDTRLLAARIQEIKGVRLDTVMTWVDAASFLDDFSSDQEWLETFIEQIEFCDVLVLMNSARLSSTEAASVHSILRNIQPGAVRLAVENASPWINHLFSWNLFDRDKTPERSATKRVFSKRPKAPIYFKSRRPFHPQRLNTLIDNWPETILRSYGTLWIASHSELALTLSQVGPAGFFISPEGYWIGTLESSELSGDLSGIFRDHPELLLDWDSTYGDRMTEIAFVSSEPLGSEWVESLNQCLLTDLEMRMDWKRFPNPFPTFEEESDSIEPVRSHLRLVAELQE